MKKIILAVLVCFLLIGCQQKTPEALDKITTTLPDETINEIEAAEPETIETPPAPEENIPEAPKEGIDIQAACNRIILPEEFASICEIDASKIKTSAQASERTCWVSFTDKTATKYTAGFTTVDWVKIDEADREFERGIGTRRATAETNVGDKNYGYQEIGRENIVWLRGSFLTRVGASTELCTKEQLVKIAEAVDAKLH